MWGIKDEKDQVERTWEKERESKQEERKDLKETKQVNEKDK